MIARLNPDTSGVNLWRNSPENCVPLLFACLTLLLIAVLNPPLHNDGICAIKVFFSASYVVLAVWVGCGLVVLAQCVGGLSESAATLDRKF